MLKNFGFGRDKTSANPAELAQTSGLGQPTDAQAARRADVAQAAQDAEKQWLAAQSDAVRVAVKETLHKHNIPASWVGSEVSLRHRSQGGSQGGSHRSPSNGKASPNQSSQALRLDIKLIVQSWQPSLLPYLPALELQVMLSLVRKKGGFDHSADSVAWQFAPDCGYRGGALPMDWNVAGTGNGTGNRIGTGVGSDHATQTGQHGHHGAGAAAKFDLPPSVWEQRHQGSGDGAGDDRDQIPSEFSASVPGFLNTIAGPQ